VPLNRRQHAGDALPVPPPRSTAPISSCPRDSSSWAARELDRRQSSSTAAPPTGSAQAQVPDAVTCPTPATPHEARRDLLNFAFALACPVLACATWVLPSRPQFIPPPHRHPRRCRCAWPSTARMPHRRQTPGEHKQVDGWNGRPAFPRTVSTIGRKSAQGLGLGRFTSVLRRLRTRRESRSHVKAVLALGQHRDVRSRSSPRLHHAPPSSPPSSASRRRRAPPDVVRLSIGLETPPTSLADLEQVPAG